MTPKGQGTPMDVVVVRDSAKKIKPLTLIRLSETDSENNNNDIGEDIETEGKIPAKKVNPTIHTSNKKVRR